MNRGKKRLGNTKIVDLSSRQTQVEQVTRSERRGGELIKIALEMSSTELIRIRKSWTKVKRVEKNWEEVDRDESRWEELARSEKSREELRRGGKIWKELQRSLRTVEKSCEKNWKEPRPVRRAAKSREVVATVDKTGTRRGRTHRTELRRCEASLQLLWAKLVFPLTVKHSLLPETFLATGNFRASSTCISCMRVCI